MTRLAIKRWLNGLLCVATVSGILACSSRNEIEGTYRDATAHTQYVFRHDGQVLITEGGVTRVAEYSIRGDRVHVTNGRGMWTLVRDGGIFVEPNGRRLEPDRPLRSP